MVTVISGVIVNAIIADEAPKTGERVAGKTSPPHFFYFAEASQSDNLEISC